MPDDMELEDIQDGGGDTGQVRAAFCKAAVATWLLTRARVPRRPVIRRRIVFGFTATGILAVDHSGLHLVTGIKKSDIKKYE